jgi:hypothetical protein
MNLIIFYIIIFINLFLVILTLDDDSSSSSFEEDNCYIDEPSIKNCKLIGENKKKESCCFLELEINEQYSTSCIRVKKQLNSINDKIYTIKHNKNDGVQYSNPSIHCKSFLNKINYYRIILIFSILIY